MRLGEEESCAFESASKQLAVNHQVSLTMSLESAIRKDRYAGKVPLVAFVMLGRLAILLFLLVALTALFGADDIAFYSFIALAFVFTIPYSLWLRDETRAERGTQLGFLVDVLIVTGIIHYTGGISSPVVLLYPLIILSSGIVGSGRLAVQSTVFSILCYATLVVLEMYAVLPYKGTGVVPYGDEASVAQTLAMRLFFFSFFAAASSYVTARCSYQRDQIERLRALVSYIFDNVSVALLAVNRDGSLAMANSTARELFQLPAEQTSGITFADLFAEKAPELDQEDIPQRLWTLRRRDGTTFPGTFEVSLTQFPVLSETDSANSSGTQRYMVALWDMTRLLELQSKANESTRLKTAVDMALELAQWIRNPLTAIKIADEYVVSVLGEPAGDNVTLSSDDLANVANMCQVIAEETQRLETKVSDLLRSTAEQDTEMFERITAEAHHWSQRVHS